MKKYYCYILTNKNRTLLYVGYTDDLKRRLLQHKNGNGANFTKESNHKLETVEINYKTLK